MVQVEADAIGFPSELQEALKESTKLDAEYNLLTGVPKTRVFQKTYPRSRPPAVGCVGPLKPSKILKNPKP